MGFLFPPVRSRAICFACMLSALLSATGQEEGEFRGSITDLNTGEPVIFATVQIIGLSKGVISNAEGDFRIPYNIMPLEARLRISSMGYETRELSVGDYPVGKVAIIQIRPQIFFLNEAVVTADRREPSARTIVRRAIRAIPENYPQSPFSLVGYYRDYQKDSMGYVNLNEAILEAFDAGFTATDSSTTRVRVYDLLENQRFRRDTLALKPYDYVTRQKVIDRAYLPGYGGNEYSILRVHDPIRNYRVNSFDFINVLEKGLLSHHFFRKEEPVYLDGELLYHIRVTRRKPDYIARGSLYVSKDRYAIHKLEYAIHTTASENGSGSWHDQEYPNLIFDLKVEYREHEGRMFLNYISFQNAFEIWLPAVFDFSDLMVDLDCRCFVVSFTSVPDTESVRRPGAIRIWYQGKQLKFKDVIIQDQSVLLIPDMDDVALTLLLLNMRTADQLKNPKYGKPSDLIKFKLGRILDQKGNLLGFRERREYRQFREFFTQQVNAHRSPPEKGPFMLGDHPVFESAIHPGSVPDGSFWMNTPLQQGLDGTDRDLR